MKAVILAAGKGTRLRPLSYFIPKGLLPLAGKPVLDYMVENLAAGDEIDGVFVAASEEIDALSRYLSHRRYKGGVSIFPVKVLSWETGGDLRLALDKAGIDETFLVCNGDVLTRVKLASLLRFHRGCVNDLTLVSVLLFPIDAVRARRFGVARVQGRLVTNFEEKPARLRRGTALVNAGYYVFDSAILSHLDDYLPARVGES